MKQRILINMALFVLASTASAQPVLNRSIGQYPGAPSENYAPTLVTNDSYRNVALYRTTYQSSAWDFNLTSQLLTDGIVSTTQPILLNVTTPDGPIAPNRREGAIDGNEWTNTLVMGDKTWLQYDWQGMNVDFDEVEMIGSMAYRTEEATKGFRLRLLTSQDGKHWTVADEWQGDSLPGRESYNKAHSDPNKNSGDDDLLPTRNIKHTFRIESGQPFKGMRLELRTPGAAHWTFTELKMRKNGTRARGILPATNFSSAWRSLGTGNEWVTIDLGAIANIDKVKLYWLNKAVKGDIQLSKDNINWQTAAQLSKKANKDNSEEIALANITAARYVRVNMAEPKNKKLPYALSEIEVMGTGGLVAQPHEQAGWQDNKWLLDGGDWRLQRATQVNADGDMISSEGFGTDGWLVATVPATVLSSYVNAGALPDMNYDDNLMLSSEAFFNGDFWYRRTFDLPAKMQGKHVMLNFDGINWKADIWLNGKKVDRIEGAFKRGKIDITPYLKDKNNVLAVRIIANANPGGVKVKTEKNTDFNGGLLGADNPTFHATIGWDWISSIRGRDIGIWDDVYLTASRDVLVSDPVITTKLATSDTLATMTPAVILTNISDKAVTGKLSGHIGTILFEKEVTVPAGKTIEEIFNPEEFTKLKDQRMRLWWPNGYGEPYLYNAGFTFIEDGQVSDAVAFKAGIREMKTVDKDTKLRIYINNRRLVPLGGNWAFSENNLNYRGREFDAAVRHHKEMNYNMIRNWVGMTGDREFYEACDRYGIMVWQDFWLANPADGPDPEDETMFMDNAKDFVLKIRNHPSIGIYCGRNEGYPPKTIDNGLRQAVATMHPSLDYISSSADDGVSGHGPYWALSTKEYFTRQTGKLHTERGMPNVMNIESLSRAIAPEHLWPQNIYWGRHDFTMEGAQRGATFNQLIANDFGEPTSAQEFTTWAQWINYEGYRAMYESGSQDRMGLLIWMSHPCWPSMVWQTYDYYFEPTAAYFGVKHACEPLHVQWNPESNRVEVVNRSAGKQNGIVKAEVRNLDGNTMWEATLPYSSTEDSTIDAMAVEVPSDNASTYFLRLTLFDNKGKEVSRNDYVCPNAEGNRNDIHNMRTATLKGSIESAQVDGNICRASILLDNRSSVPAVMIRLNLKGTDGEQILPAIYSDNYLHLMPGEQRVIDLEWKLADGRNVQPVVEISGANVPLQTINF